METKEGESQYVVTREAARAAFSALRGSKAHNHLLGYLCLLRDAPKKPEQRWSQFKPDYPAFFKDFLQAEGLTDSHPFLHPFNRPEPTQYKNIGGSYAQSSLRPSAPLRQVARLDEAGATLIPDAAPKVLKAILGGEKISGLALTVFLFRDYSFSPLEASPQGLIEVFKSIFGVGEGDFEALFSAPFAFDGDLFEVFDAKQ